MAPIQAKQYVAFLRSINVGGHAVLPMNELKVLCEKLGFQQVRTYIQSGNVIFESALTEGSLREQVEAALRQKIGKPIPVAVRTIDQLATVYSNNPFPKAEPAKVGVMFFTKPVSKDFLSGVSTSTREEVKPGKREIYIHYPNGMGRSKLKLPKQGDDGTVRNINTIQKLIELCKGSKSN